MRPRWANNYSNWFVENPNNILYYYQMIKNTSRQLIVNILQSSYLIGSRHSITIISFLLTISL